MTGTRRIVRRFARTRARSSASPGRPVALIAESRGYTPVPMPEIHLTDPDCPLCGQPGPALFHRDRVRSYRRCGTCALVFVPAAEHLSAAAEKAQYDHHENALDDPGYRRFLSRLAQPVLARVPAGTEGLDVGCGPAPLLARLLVEGGLRMQVYDPFYAADATVWTRRWDLLTASEVVEHFRAPGQEFDRLFAALNPGGLLAVMTKRVRDADAFARWHYILDPTHVAFYAEDTFAWLAARHGATLEVIGDDVVAFRAGGPQNVPSPPPGIP